MNRISIGMPVYNGDNFLKEALESILAQTFGDFELIISDNASTDATQEICRDYERKDRRVKYYREEQNYGAAWNFNRVFELSTSPYFKWAAHDDLCAPEFLKRCIKILDSNSSVILCQSKTKLIDENGIEMRDLHVKPNLDSSRPHVRFLASLFSPPCIPIHGVIRADILAKTRLFDKFSSADRTLVSELALLGPWYEIDEYLFFWRRHDHQSTGVDYPSRHVRQAWFDPTRAGKVTFPHWRLLFEYLVSINRAPLAWYERLWCYIYVARRAARDRHHLVKNLILKEQKLKKTCDHLKRATE